MSTEPTDGTLYLSVIKNPFTTMFIHVTLKQAIRSTSKGIEIFSVAAIVGDVDGYPMFAGLATGVGIGDEQPRSRRQTITTEHADEYSNVAS